MGIKRIRVENFKSYRSLDVTLGPLNVLIGANASGKSNFVEVFRFLRDIAVHGLDDAISLQGGLQYLKTAQSEQGHRLSVSLSANSTGKFWVQRQMEENEHGSIFGVHVHEVAYFFSLDFAADGRPQICEDRLTLSCAFVRLAPDDSGQWEELDELGQGTIALYATQDGIPHCDLKLPLSVGLTERDILTPTTIIPEEATVPALLIEKHFLYIALFFNPSEAFLDDAIALYNLNSLSAKLPVEVSGRSNLAEDGSNLALVLRKILEDKEGSRRFLRLYRDLLPFVTDLDVERIDRSLLVKLTETYTPDRMYPATILSDGTIDIAALVVALYFQDHPVTVIEEPERNLHPYLIAKLVAMLEDVSEHKQIIVTTHSPELVKHARHEDILLVSRDSNGNSTISRPAEREHVQVFLQNDLGIEDLYVDNLLEG